MACGGDEPRLTDAAIAALHPQTPEWRVAERDGMERLERVFAFPDFARALAFTDAVGALRSARVIIRHSSRNGAG